MYFLRARPGALPLAFPQISLRVLVGEDPPKNPRRLGEAGSYGEKPKNTQGPQRRNAARTRRKKTSSNNSKKTGSPALHHPLAHQEPFPPSDCRSTGTEVRVQTCVLKTCEAISGAWSDAWLALGSDLFMCLFNFIYPNGPWANFVSPSAIAEK